MAGPLGAAQDAHPAVEDPAGFTIGGAQQAAVTMAQAMVGLYNPAQLEVLRRADAIARAARAERPAQA